MRVDVRVLFLVAAIVTPVLLVSPTCGFYRSVSIPEHHLIEISLNPTPLLAAENDPGCNPRLKAFIDSQLPNIEPVILAQLRHSIVVEAPDQVLEHLISFLAKGN